MSTDSFPGWIAKVRKDPFGAGSFNRIVSGYQWSESLFAREHILGSGEHNAAEIPREVGSVYITGGPTANIEGFRYARSVTRMALGTTSLELDPTYYDSITKMALQLQNCSEAGLTKPSMTSAIIMGTDEVQFYSKTLTSSLHTPGTNTWVEEDADFCVAIHGSPLPTGPTASVPIIHGRGETFTDTTNDWNAQVVADAGLRGAFIAEHSAAGVHTNREVAQSWADIGVIGGGGDYEVVDTSFRNECLSVTYVGIGIVTLTFQNLWTLSAQPFVMPNYQRVNGGDPKDVYVICTPRSEITTSEITCYIYKYDFAMKTWDRADTDFFIAVHAG